MSKSLRAPARTIALFVGVMLAAGACSEDDLTAPPAERLGNYILVAVNGQALPASVSLQYGSTTITRIAGGQVELRPNGTHGTVVYVQGTTGTGAPVTEVVFAAAARTGYSGDRVSLPIRGARLTGTFSASSQAALLTVPFPSPWGTLTFSRSSCPNC